MQLSVWLIRDCIPNWLNNTFFLRLHLVEGNYSLARDLVTTPWMACLVLLSLKRQQPTVASKGHVDIKGPLLLTVLEKHSVQWPNQGNVFIGTWKYFIYWCWCGSWIAYRLYYICVPCSSGSVYFGHSWKNWDLPLWASSENSISVDSFKTNKFYDS